MLYTVSAVQILVMVDGLAELEKRVSNGKRKIATFIAGLQQLDGTFAGDEWGETDTRFLYGALNALSLLGFLRSTEPALIDVDVSIAHIKACQNFDGGFGALKDRFEWKICQGQCLESGHESRCDADN